MLNVSPTQDKMNFKEHQLNFNCSKIVITQKQRDHIGYLSFKNYQTKILKILPQKGDTYLIFLKTLKNTYIKELVH